MVPPPPETKEPKEPAPKLHPLQRVSPMAPTPYAMTYMDGR